MGAFSARDIHAGVPFEHARRRTSLSGTMVKSHVDCSPDLTWALVQKANVFVRRSRSATRQKTFRSFSAETNNLASLHTYKHSGAYAPRAPRHVNDGGKRVAASHERGGDRRRLSGRPSTLARRPASPRASRSTKNPKRENRRARNSPRSIFFSVRPRARRRRHQGCRRQEPHRGRHDRRRQGHVRQGYLPAAGEDRRQPLRRGPPGPHGTSKTLCSFSAFSRRRAPFAFFSSRVACHPRTARVLTSPPRIPHDPQVDALKKISAVARAGRSAKALAK